MDYDDATDGNTTSGDLDADLTSILPYIQWQPNDIHQRLVAMLGYGKGDAELSTDDEDDEATEVDIDMQMIALGLSEATSTAPYKRSELVVESQRLCRGTWNPKPMKRPTSPAVDRRLPTPARRHTRPPSPEQASTTGAQFTPELGVGPTLG